MITIDFSNILNDNLGSNEGLNLQNLKNLQNQANNFIEQIQDKRYKEYKFLDIIYNSVDEYIKTANYIKSRFKYFVLIGIGGSSLGTEMLAQSLLDYYYNYKGDVKFFILDNIDPDKVSHTLKNIDIKETVFYVVSKSGKTIETLVNFSIVFKKVKDLFPHNWQEHFIFATEDNNNFLNRFGKKNNIKIFNIPKDVGGRFSVLTSVGLFPASVLGIDIEELLNGARYIDEKFITEKNILKNPFLLLGSIYFLLDTLKQKNILVMMPYSDKLSSFVSWFRQLWAESLGKENMGQTPVKSLGTLDQHSQFQLYMDGKRDKVITFINILKRKTDIGIPENLPEGLEILNKHSLNQILHKEYLGIKNALKSRGVPNLSINLDELTPYNMGKLIITFELATAFAGYLYGINPFNQPAVEIGKQNIYKLLREKGYSLIDNQETTLYF